MKDTTKPNITFALASLQLGILGLFFSLSLGVIMLAPIPIILSIIFGILALNKIKKDPKNYGSKKLAWAGLILSIVSIIIICLLYMTFK